jgi:hypothetical protein
MTADAHDRSMQAGPATRGSARPRWLLPALIGSAVVGSLVVLGVLSLSAVLYGGLIGGMLLMHTGAHGGHGHGDPGPGRPYMVTARARHLMPTISASAHTALIPGRQAPPQGSISEPPIARRRARLTTLIDPLRTAAARRPRELTPNNPAGHEITCQIGTPGPDRQSRLLDDTRT